LKNPFTFQALGAGGCGKCAPAKKWKIVVNILWHEISAAAITFGLEAILISDPLDCKESKSDV
jgi:hypothetical protein